MAVVDCTSSANSCSELEERGVSAAGALSLLLDGILAMAVPSRPPSPRSICFSSASFATMTIPKLAGP
eukprot:scaffold870_cov268-Pinguiococcus_pyrenoidosus.AAC.42